MNKIYILAFLFSCLFTQNIHAQCPSVDNCSEVICIIGPNEIENTIYTTSGFTSGVAAGFCGTVENEQWFGVIAADSTITVTATPINCNTGDGIQVALYEDCGSLMPIACYGGVAEGWTIPATFTTQVDYLGQVYYLMVDGYAGDQCQFTIAVEGLAESAGTHVIKCQVSLEQNLDCIKDSLYIPAEGVKVNIETNHLSVRATKDDGTVTYLHLYDDPILVYLDTITSGFWSICEDTVVVQPQIAPDTTVVNFLLKPNGPLCPSMDIEMSLFNIRTCNYINVPLRYTNYGNTTAENVKINFIFPANKGLVYDSATNSLYNSILPIQNGDSLVFDIGAVAPFKTRQLNVILFVPCDTALLGQTLCFTSETSISNECPQTASSYPKVKVEAACLGDSTVQFTIANIGGAPMFQSSEYRVIRNDEILEMGTFMLQNGGSVILNYPANGFTYRLEANQASNYPGISNPSVFVESCGGLSPNFVNIFAQNDIDPAIDIECRIVRASYDPNIKTASPSGVGTEHIMEANQPLEYNIEFQNTGNDTAFLVILEDILPPTLAVHSFRPGPSSHPYTWEIESNNILTFRFDPILLPDSTTNPIASRGFVEFTIDQMPDLPIGTRIENYANIYFDINAPIRTPTAFHTIGKLLLVSTDAPINKKPSQWQILGNPTVDKAIFTNPKATNGEYLFQLIDVQGKLVNSEVFFGNRYEFERKQLATGVYFFKIMDKKGRVSSGKIAVE
jgi:uncharacterized repeat protein (TIGR01451 family)